VVVTGTIMKRGRPGMRIEVLCAIESAGDFERRLFGETSTIGVRRRAVERTALDRSQSSVDVLGHPVTVKTVRLPDGTQRVKPEFLDVQRVALATGRPLQDIFRLALTAAERV
jgi:pyridinium-3,5-bisthiocarboxylic acid mononucleotide nickel chelatase